MKRVADRGMLAAALALVGLLAGCEQIGYFMANSMPEAKETTVEAEFEKFAGRNVMVVIHGEPQIEYEYRGHRRRLAYWIAGKLRQNVENISLVNCDKVLRYQLENLHWDDMQRTELGKKFQADYVLFVALQDYSMREPGTTGVFRGRIVAQSTIYDTSKPERNAIVWGPKDISVIYPPRSPTGQLGRDDRVISNKTQDLFAEKLTKKFYRHKVPAKS